MTAIPIQKLMGTGIPAEAAKLLGSTPQLAATAAGTVQTDALLLIGDLVQVTTTALNAGVRLPAASRTDIDKVVIRNDGANALKVYPATGENFNVQSANASLTGDMAAGTGKIFCRVSPTRWISLP